ATGAHFRAFLLHADLQRVGARAIDVAWREVQHVARSEIRKYTAKRRRQVFTGRGGYDSASGFPRELVVETADRNRRASWRSRKRRGHVFWHGGGQDDIDGRRCAPGDLE